jgi:hypothetical protein
MIADPLPKSGIIHLVNIFDEGELAEAAICKDYLQVRLEGVREDSQPLAVDLHFEKTVSELKEMGVLK